MIRDAESAHLAKVMEIQGNEACLAAVQALERSLVARAYVRQSLRAFISTSAGGGEQGQLLREDIYSRGKRHLEYLLNEWAHRSALAKANAVLKEVLTFLETVGIKRIN